MENPIVTVVCTLIAAIIGLFVKSPLAEKIPQGYSSRLLEAVAAMRPEDYHKMWNDVRSVKARRDLAVEMASRYLQPDVAEEAVDFITGVIRR